MKTEKFSFRNFIANCFTYKLFREIFASERCTHAGQHGGRSEGSQGRIEAGPAGQDRERTGAGTTGYLQDGCMQDRKGMNKTCG